MTLIDVLAFTTAIISFLTAVIGLALYIIKRQNSNAFYKTIDGMVNLQQHQDLLFDSKESELERILLISSQNGGGMPRIGSELSISVVLESCNLKKTDGSITHWQKRIMDGEYYALMAKMITAKLSPLMDDYHAFRSQNLNEFGILRKTLESQCVEYCRMYYIGQKYRTFLGLKIQFIPTKLYFLGVNYTKTPTKKDSTFDSHILDYIDVVKKKLSLS